MDVGSIHKTNKYGNLRVIKYKNNVNVFVEFILTGYRSKTSVNSIRNGTVKDNLCPRVYGVGFIGVGPHKSAEKGKNTKVYKTWIGMLERCYCPKSMLKNPTYKGCYVTPEWHNFQVFAEWFYSSYIQGYELDKDVKVSGNRVYSPDTCLFVTHKVNTVKARAKRCKFINPEGEVVEVYNIAEFCRGKDLSGKSMARVITGERKKHKGWHKSV